jgi:hypothetical protein
MVTSFMPGQYEKPLFRPVGDRGLLVEYGDSIAPEINRKVRVMTLALVHERLTGVLEVIPAYRSLMMIYDPMRTSPLMLQRAVESLEQRLDKLTIPFRSCTGVITGLTSNLSLQRMGWPWRMWSGSTPEQRIKST